MHVCLFMHHKGMSHSKIKTILICNYRELSRQRSHYAKLSTMGKPNLMREASEFFTSFRAQIRSPFQEIMFRPAYQRSLLIFLFLHKNLSNFKFYDIKVRYTMSFLSIMILVELSFALVFC
jgi:hypothetical protein